MASAVQDDLGHGLHALATFAAGFVIGGLGQALQIARGVQGVGQTEGTGGVGGQADAAQGLVGGLAAQLLEAGGHQLGLAVTLG